MFNLDPSIPQDDKKACHSEGNECVAKNPGVKNVD